MFSSYPPKRNSSPSPEAPATLYSSSVHQPIDKKASKRREKYKETTDPTKVTLFILFLALLYWLLPIPSPFSIYTRASKNKFVNNCNCNSNQLDSRTMPWQKTFALSSRTKGCHLITSEVQKEISEGLKGVKVSLIAMSGIGRVGIERGTGRSKARGEEKTFFILDRIP